ncbi:hypothetical protein HOP50_18g81200 [Chloropicon primus]|nr:hypothetical protein HOP50_18g81200 [Chloropicon primus]
MRGLVLVLRKHDLSKEADDGESACETLFRLEHCEGSGSEGGMKPSLGFETEGEREDLHRYLISIDNLHRDVCGSRLSTCSVSKWKTKERKEEFQVAFRRLVGTEVLFVFARPTQGGGQDQDNFKVASELVFLVLGACGYGMSGDAELHTLAGDRVPDAVPWLTSLLAGFGEGQASRRLAATGDADRCTKVRDVIVRHLLESGSSSYFLSVFDLHFTILSKHATDGSYEVTYADDLRECILPWLLCNVPPHGDDELVPGEVYVRSSLRFGERDEPCDSGMGCFVKVCESGSLRLCIMCTPKPDHFRGVVKRANWDWITRGVEALGCRILRDVERGLPKRKKHARSIYMGRERFSTQ